MRGDGVVGTTVMENEDENIVLLIILWMLGITTIFL